MVKSRKTRKAYPVNERRSRLLHELKRRHAYTVFDMADMLGISETLMADYLAGEEMYLTDAFGLTIILGATLDQISCLTEREWRKE